MGEHSPLSERNLENHQLLKAMHDPLHPARHWRIKPKASWIFMGFGLLVTGLLLTATVTLTAVGVPMALIGMMMIVASSLRFLRGKLTRYLR